MGRVLFNMTIHCHQPVGNFDSVFERAFTQCYRPFFETLHAHPDVKTTLHFSGCLFEWLEAHHPGFFDLLKDLADRDQAEYLTGGFYEPILAAIPDWDAQGQVEMLTAYLAERFGVTAPGAWLTERVWEPGLARKLADAGVDWTLLDDTIFRYSGVTPDRMWGYYLTEDQNRPLGVFPAAKTLRHTIPFQEPEATLDYLAGYATDDGDRLVVYGDDGEKFGEWPDTHEYVHEQGWLDRFFTQLEASQDWITMTHLGAYYREHPPQGRIYLPSSSYEEMLGWALPADAGEAYRHMWEEVDREGRREDFAPFLKGGTWRDFLTKYEESNHLQKRVFHVSRMYQAAEADASTVKARAALAVGRRDLWRAQCNCMYWHGVFGGLYLSHIRRTNYEYLNRAEGALLKDRAGVTAESVDLNLDGREEILLTSAGGTIVVTPHYGGSLREWSVRPPFVNLLNGLTRRAESYHGEVREAAQRGDAAAQGEAPSIHDGMRLKEPGLDEKLITDWYQRGGLTDHLLGEGTTLEGFARCDYPELGDFVDQPFESAIVEDGGGCSVRLVRRGLLADQPFAIEKVVSVGDTGREIRVTYRFENPSAEARDVWFGCETTFILPGCAGPGVFLEFGDDAAPRVGLGAPAEAQDIQRALAMDETAGVGLVVECGEPFDCWSFPVETVSLSEGGAELTYQGTSLMPHWRFPVPPGGRKELVVVWRVVV